MSSTGKFTRITPKNFFCIQKNHAQKKLLPVDLRHQYEVKFGCSDHLVMSLIPLVQQILRTQREAEN